MTTESEKPGSISRSRRATSPAPQRNSILGGRWLRLLGGRTGRMLAAGAVPIIVLLAGCGGSASTKASNNTFSISPGTATIDTNCTGCNATSNQGQVVEQFSATLSGGGAAPVTWAVSGGDANSGAGTINSSGQYTPPNYLTADTARVTVTATLASGTGAGTTASATITVTPGFLEPLSPENVALGTNGTVTVTGSIAEAGGSTGINYAVANSSTGSSGGQGSLGSASCLRSSKQFTSCTVTYTAPGTITTTAATFIVGTVGTTSSKTSTQVLLNTAGISSNPATHQTQLATPVLLGSSGGNNSDYDTQNGQIVDCCGGTLGALIQNSGGTQYILSCNHVLARSDQASVGEAIVQPGLIDNNCTPNGSGSGTTQVGVLTTWLPLSASTTNVDAAIAQVNSGAVNSSGAIMELGLPGAGGLLSAAPPGTSSTHGTGENGTIGMSVAKSGRTTGLTCANITAVNLSVQVGYFKDCDETTPYLTKTYINQISIEGNDFSDAGDSGSLVVDSADAEPVGLFFAGGVSNTGVDEGVANPAPTVLAELNTQSGTTYTFVGTTDHPVSCLNYGNATVTAAQGTSLNPSQSAAAQDALSQARALVNPSAGILGVATGKSSDHAGQPTVVLYVDQNMRVNAPQVVNGVRTEVITTTPEAFAAGNLPKTAVDSGALPSLSSAVFSQAVAIKEQSAPSLMKQNPAFFGVGVGQSFDNPREASLVIFVDRNQVPASLPATIGGLRTRYVIMNRLHVTRSYLGGQIRQQSHCALKSVTRQWSGFDPLHTHELRGLDLQ